MRVSLTQRDWLQQCNALTVSPDREDGSRRRVAGVEEDLLAGSQELVADLVRAAAVYVGATHCLHGDAQATCALAGQPGGREACQLARVFAPHAAASLDDPQAGARYLAALRDAAAAVYYCRRIAHAAGGCWFAPPRGLAADQPDLCAQVLTIVHRLG